MRRVFDLTRLSEACDAVQAGIRCAADGDDATVVGGAIRELLDVLGAELREPVPGSQDGPQDAGVDS